MYYNNLAWIATANEPVFLEPSMANRHGLITGATGTGKSTTLKVMAETFSSMGVPVFLSDVKGDLSGVCQAGEPTEKVMSRLTKLGVPTDSWEFTGFPTRFWDMFGEVGHPVRVTISDIGPTLLSRMLNLSDVQAGVLNLVFHIADEKGLLLMDMKDLRSMLSYCADHRNEFTTDYGNMSTQSIGAIQRSLLSLEQEGGDIFFGEPGLDIMDWIMCDDDGRGFINVLNAKRLINSPLLYSTFLLWMLSELFEKLPEEGDLDIPKMVFFFDEAHLLFNDAPKPLLDKITQIVKLIRSKGVGIYFISQTPADIPDSVLSQLQNRVQHALHAYTPAEQKAVKVAAQSFRPNKEFSTEEAISTLGVGEALLSFLDSDGVPGIVQRGKILPPQGLMSPADETLVEKIILESEMEELYRESFDRESAFEMLAAQQELDEAKAKADELEKQLEKEEQERQKMEAKAEAARQKAAEREAAALQKEIDRENKARLREMEKQIAAEKRRAEQAAAAAERERRKQEAAMLRELNKTVRKAVTGKSTTRSTSSRSTTRKTTRVSTPRATYNYSYPTPEQQLTSLGIEVGKSIVRGIFGNRI